MSDNERRIKIEFGKQLSVNYSSSDFVGLLKRESGKWFEYVDSDSNGKRWIEIIVAIKDIDIVILCAEFLLHYRKMKKPFRSCDLTLFDIYQKPGVKFINREIPVNVVLSAIEKIRSII